MSDDLPDIVYVVRPGEGNLSLRYSLRSLGNLPHRRVFIAGHCPSWVRDVTAIPVRKLPSKLNAIEANLRAALRHPEIGERCVYFNDDFYVTKPIDEVPVTHGGPVTEFTLRQEFRWRMNRTIDEFYKRRNGDAPHEMFTYDGVHMPLPLDVERTRQIIMDMPSGLLWRTWYGNVAAIGGVRVENTKSRKGEVPNETFLSTNGATLGLLRQYLEDVLPRGGPYA